MRRSAHHSLTHLMHVLLMLLILSAGSAVLADPAPKVSESPPQKKVRLQEAYGKLPLSFEANKGQTDAQVKFLSRGPGYSLFLTSSEAVLALKQAETKVEAKTEALTDLTTSNSELRTSNTVLRMRLVGANPAAPLSGLEELPGKVSYFIGNDPKKWRTNIPTYAKVKYWEVYPGIDLVYYGNQRQLEYDLIVAPGADPDRVELSFHGADGIKLDGQGNLILAASGGELHLLKPHVYQVADDKKVEIAAKYVLLASGADSLTPALSISHRTSAPRSTPSPINHQPSTIGFRVASYDRSRPLVIDPTLVYSTYLGGSGNDAGSSIAVDASGNAYVTGATTPGNFPITAGAVQPAHGGGNSDAFVAKLNATGTALLYSTYLGGRSNLGGSPCGGDTDAGSGIAVDASGQAYVTGHTGAVDFPVTAGAVQPVCGGPFTDAFVAKLNATGTALVYSTYLGGNSLDQGLGIAVDAAGAAYVTGNTGSADFTAGCTAPCTVLDATPGGMGDAFVTKLNATGTALVYSTYLGGSGPDRGHGIAVDAAGAAYVTGNTESADFTAGCTAPCTVLDSTLGGGVDAFVTALNAMGTALLYSTYLGGSSVDIGHGIAVDTSGQAYVTGTTRSPNFPTTAGAVQPAFGGGFTDAFVAKLNTAGTALAYSTYLGGSGIDDVGAIAVDAAGAAYVAGSTSSADFPTTPGAVDTTSNGGFDVFVTKLNPAGSSLDYSTYLGGSGGSDTDMGSGIAVDAAGAAYVTGSTDSADFPTTAGAFQPRSGGVQPPGEAFVAKLSEIGSPATLTLEPTSDSNPVNTEHCVTATVKDALGNPTPNVTINFAVTGAVNTSGSATTDANGQATFCYTGPQAPGTDDITAYADTDNDNVQDAGEPSGGATKTWVASAPATLTLTPPTATNPVRTQHCVTATVQEASGNPRPNVTVNLAVTGAVNTGGSATTDADGRATFCYVGPQKRGSDTITAYADTDHDTVQDADEPTSTATTTWVKKKKYKDDDKHSKRGQIKHAK